MFQARLDSALRQEAGLNELMLMGLDFYADLSDFVVNQLAGNINTQLPSKSVSNYAHEDLRAKCLQAILFKSVFRKTILSWVAYNKLGSVIINPKRNKSFYSYSRLKHLTMLDMGGLNGFEEIYPRYLECSLYHKKILSLNSLCKQLHETITSPNIGTFAIKSIELENAIRQSLQ